MWQLIHHSLKKRGEKSVVVNALIRYVDDMGWGRAIYDAAFPANIVALLIFYLVYRKKYALPWWKAALTWVFTVGGISVLNSILASAMNGFRADGSANILYAFVYFPLICLLVSKLLREKPGIMLDYMAPAIVIWHIIGQSVCPFFGCCAGIPCTWGIWNPLLDRTVFPVQWMISLAALLVFLFILQYAKKRQYDGSGRVYPIMLILLGVVRFFLEFLKDTTKIVWDLTELSLHALFMVLVGTIWYLTMEEIRLEKERGHEKYGKQKTCNHTYRPNRRV